MGWTLRQSIGNNTFDCTDEVPSLRFGNDFSDSGGSCGLGKSRHVQHGKQHQGCFRVKRGHGASGFETIHIRHGEIDQDQVGSQLVEFCDSGMTRFRFATDGPFTRINDRSKDATRSFGVVHDQNAEFHRERA
jgi:hypothetical protein